jgi:hypothetical protein
MGLDAIVFAPLAIIFLYLCLRRLFKKVNFTKDEELRLESYGHTNDIAD